MIFPQVQPFLSKKNNFQQATVLQVYLGVVVYLAQRGSNLSGHLGQALKHQTHLGCLSVLFVGICLQSHPLRFRRPSGQRRTRFCLTDHPDLVRISLRLLHTHKPLKKEHMKLQHHIKLSTSLWLPLDKIS